MDVLSAILKTIHLRGSVYFNTCFHSPWGLDIAYSNTAAFHIIERGQCWLQMEGMTEPKPLVGGDILILPKGTRHQISDQPESLCLSGTTAVQQIMEGHNPFDGDGEGGLNIVCGHF